MTLRFRVIPGTPIDENELIANQITRITNAITATDLERTRLLDAYQAGPLELGEPTPQHRHDHHQTRRAPRREEHARRAKLRARDREPPTPRTGQLRRTRRFFP
jgi:hypothetical protein